MRSEKLLRIGGYVSGGVLIAFGIGVIVLGIWGISFTRDHLEQEGITFGPVSDPAVAEHAEQYAGQQVKTGSQALAFANVMREHTLESTGGLTYAQMGRFAVESGDPAGTNDAKAALTDGNGKPVANQARNTQLTAASLVTALSLSAMAIGASYGAVALGVAFTILGIVLAGLGYALLGLITPERRGTQRIYHRRDRTRLNLILRGRRLGFPLEQIRTIIDLFDAPRGRRAQLEYVLGQIDVRRAVERIFDVKVASVRLSRVPPKQKRTRGHLGYRPGWRKAYVRLKPGQKTIEYFEGV